MPFYDYKCTACDAVFEINKGMEESADPKCPACDSPSRRVFYAPRINRSSVDLSPGGSSGCPSCSSGACSSCGGH